jgi:hypothetical protein
MPNNFEEDYRKFSKVLKKLRSDGKISDEPAPSDKIAKRKYIEKLTKLFKKEVYGSD